MRPDRILDPAVLKDFVESESGLSFHKNNLSWIFTCPRCGREKKFYLRKSDGHYICFYCAEVENFKGKAPEYGLAELLGVKPQEIAARLYGEGVIEAPSHFRFDLRGRYAPASDEVEEDLDEEDEFGPEPLFWPYNFMPLDHPHSKRGVDYLAGRGIPLDIAAEYHVRYAPSERRVYFPVEEDEILYGWQGRTILKDLKYFDEAAGKIEEILKIESNPGLPREQMLMFGDRLRGMSHAVLCEGPVDAIKAHLCGGNVAAMGKGVSPGQIKAMLRRLKETPGPKRLYLALDPDASVETQRLVRAMADELEVYEMKATENGDDKADLGAMSFKEVRELFLRAPRVGTRKLFLHFRPARA